MSADYRAAMAQPDPKVPTEREISEWINTLPLWHGATRDELPAIVLRALSRWGRPAVAPIVPPDLIRALELAEAGLSDIGDADREPGDDLAWAEARAAQDLPRIRQVLNLWRSQTTAGSYAGLRDALRQIITLCDGLATDDVSDEFLCRAPGEVKALLEKLRGAAAVPPVAQPEPGELTDEEIMELMPQNVRDDLKKATSRMVASWAMAAGVCRVVLNSGAVKHCRAAIAADRARHGRPAVEPVAVEALHRLRKWGGLMGSTGYSADVVLGVIDWIDGGMTAPLPPLPDHIAALPTTPQESQS